MKKPQNKLLGVYLTDIFKEMCKRVGADYDEMDFSKDKWYEDYTWTEREKEKFIAWFAKYLQCSGPRRELCKYSSCVYSVPDRLKFATKFSKGFLWKVVG